MVTLSFASPPAAAALSVALSAVLLSVAVLLSPADVSALAAGSACVAFSVANTAGFIVNSVTAASTPHTILFAFFFINLIIFPPNPYHIKL